MEYPRYVKVIIDRLADAGYEAYIVGGSLRDMLIGRAPSDFDVATSALPDRMLEIFSDMKTIPTGLQHGTVTVLSDGEPIEVTTFRTDGEYLDSRHPESVSFTSDIRDDLSRRDFTVNAIAYNEKRGIVDPFGGENDIRLKILRAVGDADTRMREDALRIMRGLRFSAQLGFSIEENTLSALGRTKGGLADISRERIGVELMKLVCSPYPEEPLHIMIESGISKYIIGDFVPTDKAIASLSTLTPEPVARLSCLLWGADEETAREILNSLKYSNAQKNGVLTALSAHTSTLPERDADVRRFIIRLGDRALLAAELLEIFGEAPGGFLEKIKNFSSMDFARKISDLTVNGADLMALGMSGKELGAALSYLFDIVTESPDKNEKETLLNIALSQ